MLMLVAVPIGLRSCSGESDRWRAASAMELYLDGDKQAAIEQLTEVSERLPEDYQIKLKLGTWLLDDQQAEQALQVVKQVPENWQDREITSLIQRCYLALGQPNMALQEYQRVNPADATRSPDQLLMHRNSLSYYQALASQDLPLALENSNFVADSLANYWNGRHNLPMSATFQAFFCTARIYQHVLEQSDTTPEKKEVYQRDALEILTGAIDLLRSEHEKLKAARSKRDAVVDQESNSVGDAALRGDKGAADQQSIQDLTPETQRDLAQQKPPSKKVQLKRMDDVAQSLAAMLTLRAMVFQSTEQLTASFEDRQQVADLGFDPEQVRQMLPDFAECNFHLDSLASVLDTRGCVHLQLKNLQKALVDLNVAIAAQTALVEVVELAPRTSIEVSLDPRQQRQTFVLAPRRTLAVLLYHRACVYQLGVTQAGSIREKTRLRRSMLKDLFQIHELGFQPGSHLN